MSNLLRMWILVIHLVIVPCSLGFHFVFTVIGRPGLGRIVQKVAMTANDDVQQLTDDVDKFLAGAMLTLKFLHLSLFLFDPVVSVLEGMPALRLGAVCALCCVLFARAVGYRINRYGEYQPRDHFASTEVQIRNAFCVDVFCLESIMLLVAGVDLQPMLLERVVSGASVLTKKKFMPPQLFETGHAAVDGILEKVLNIKKATSSKKARRIKYSEKR